MLSSSDAKLRCLWHMVVWSILLILVSQFLVLTDHIAFYIFAALCNLVLPVVTSIYSTTAGRHGAGLLRVSYVLCDPVLACITVLPLLLFNHLPRLVDEYSCLTFPSLNESLVCLRNHTVTSSSGGSKSFDGSEDRDIVSIEPIIPLSEAARRIMLSEKHARLVVIQISLLFPALLTLSMGRRTRKMNLTTCLLVVTYWLITSIEVGDLIEVAMLGHQYIHYIYTTAAIASIAMILSSSYGGVTLCSYISPMGSTDDKVSRKRFDFLYKCLIGVAGIVFVEIPLLVARCQILMVGTKGPNWNPYLGVAYRPLPASFGAWLIKDVVFIGLIAALIIVQRVLPFRKLHIISSQCSRVSFDDPHVFQPEKRDVYIGRHNNRRTTGSGVSRKPVTLLTADRLRDGAPSRESSIRGSRPVNDETGSGTSRHSSITSLNSSTGVKSFDTVLSSSVPTEAVDLETVPVNGAGKSKTNVLDCIEEREELSDDIPMTSICNGSNLNENIHASDVESSGNNANVLNYDLVIGNVDESIQHPATDNKLSDEDEDRTMDELREKKQNERTPRYTRAMSESGVALPAANDCTDSRHLSRQFSSPERDRKVCKKVSFHLEKELAGPDNKDVEIEETSLQL